MSRMWVAWVSLTQFVRATVIVALTYGYLPFLILPLYASLDRIDGATSGGT